MSPHELELRHSPAQAVEQTTISKWGIINGDMQNKNLKIPSNGNAFPSLRNNSGQDVMHDRYSPEINGLSPP